MSLRGRFAVGGLAAKGMGPAPPAVKGEGLAPNSEGVGARDSTTTDGLGPPATERGSGEASPNAWKGLAEGSRVVFLRARGTIVWSEKFSPKRSGVKRVLGQ